MKLALLLCGLFTAGMTAATAAESSKPGNSPALNDAVILIIRHAEKPPAGDQLSAAGQARAQAYVNFFKNFTLDGQPCKLDYMFAAADSKESQRARLTIEPTSKVLGLTIDNEFEDAHFQKLADEIRAKPHGKHILICWHHGEIPQLVKALGADPGRLFPKGKWPDEVFNWVVILRYDANGCLTQASRGSEQF